MKDLKTYLSEDPMKENYVLAVLKPGFIVQAALESSL